MLIGIQSWGLVGRDRGESAGEVGGGGGREDGWVVTHVSRGLRASTEMVRTALAANPGVIEARTPERAPRLATVAKAAACFILKRRDGEKEKGESNKRVNNHVAIDDDRHHKKEGGRCGFLFFLPKNNKDALPPPSGEVFL